MYICEEFLKLKYEKHITLYFFTDVDDFNVWFIF